MLAHAVGFIMSIVAFVVWLPQATLVLKNRKAPAMLAGVSIWTQILALFNALGWGLYAVLTGALWSGAPGIVNGPLAIMTIILLVRARRTLVTEHVHLPIEITHDMLEPEDEAVA